MHSQECRRGLRVRPELARREDFPAAAEIRLEGIRFVAETFVAARRLKWDIDSSKRAATKAVWDEE